MEAFLESELMEREKLINECLKLEIELNKLKKRWKVKKKKNLVMEQHNLLLEDELVVLRKQSFEDDYKKVIAVRECQVVLRNVSGENELKTIDQQANNQRTPAVLDKKFKCEYQGCEKKYTLKENLFKHQNLHTKKYQCQVCQQCFEFSSRFQDHCRNHVEERPFVCDKCNHRFKYRDSLKYHIKSKHLNENLFKCDEIGCYKSFQKRISFLEHQKCHLILRPFHCQQEGCKKQFKVKKELSRHVKRVHVHVKTFRCDFDNCPKLYKTRTHLERHKKTHK